MPYCIFNLVNPILSFVFDLIRYGIKYLTSEQAAEAYGTEPEQVAHYGVGG
jgi:hypothetical protein